MIGVVRVTLPICRGITQDEIIVKREKFSGITAEDFVATVHLVPYDSISSNFVLDDQILSGS